MNPLAPTPGPLDLRFRLFGTPVRIQPSFWLFGVFLGWLSTGGEPRLLLIFLAAFCLATLVHEMGHALMSKFFREPCQIVLFAFGGAAITQGEGSRLRGWHRVLIALAGPAAGLLVYGLWKGAELGFESWMAENPQAFGWETKARIRNILRSHFAHFFLFMSLLYNLMNLLPIYPMDGGQVVRELCLGIAPTRGVQLSLFLSFATAAFVAIYSALKKWHQPDLWYPPLDPIFSVIMFGLMALENLFGLMRERRPAPAPADEPY